MLRTRRQILGWSLFATALFASCRLPNHPEEVSAPTASPADTPVPSPSSTPPPPPTSTAEATATVAPLATPTSVPPSATSVAPANPTTVVESTLSQTLEIAIDQIGYVPALPKVATIAPIKPNSKVELGPLHVVSVDSGAVVATIGTTGPVLEPETGGRGVWLADLSSVTTEGTYRIRVNDGGDSPRFRIGNAAVADLFSSAVRSYYLNRCGVVVDDGATGIKHAACHLSEAVLDGDSSVRVDLQGGWHDAGDYGRYVPTAAVTIGQFLLLAEHVPAAARVSLNGTDLLAETRFELDWLLKMQRPDGGVYHKVSTANFAPFISPELDDAALILYTVGSADTAASAAAFARGARIFGEDRSYTQKLADAATRAWRWLTDHPRQLAPTIGKTGSYLSPDDRDTREWAAAELFALTGDRSFEAFLKARPRTSVSAPSWADTSDLALLTYAFAKGADSEYRDRAGKLIVSLAKERAASAREHPYGVALRPSEYTWGSAKTALAIAEHCLLANLLEPDRVLVTAAADQLHWVLGRNPLGQSFVTGSGARSPRHPHHRLVASGGKMIPGMLVGGPNSRAEDGIAPAKRGPRSYIDDQEAYSVNEPAIDYNAPLVFVAGWLAYRQV